MPAAIADRARRQAALDAHVVGELADDIGECIDLRLRWHQTTQEAKPAHRGLDEPLPTEFRIPHSTATLLTSDPSVARDFDLLRVDQPIAIEVELPSDK